MDQEESAFRIEHEVDLRAMLVMVAATVVFLWLGLPLLERVDGPTGLLPSRAFWLGLGLPMALHRVADEHWRLHRPWRSAVRGGALYAVVWLVAWAVFFGAAELLRVLGLPRWASWALAGGAAFIGPLLLAEGLREFRVRRARTSGASRPRPAP